MADDPIHVDECAAGLIAEARANHGSFGITVEVAHSLSVEDVVSFVREIMDAQERQIMDRFGESHSMTFFCWRSAQTAKLEVGLVSASHRRLPFEIPFQDVDDLGAIARSFLADPYHEGRRLAETREALEEGMGACESKPSVLHVWQSTIPRIVAEPV